MTAVVLDDNFYPSPRLTEPRGTMPRSPPRDRPRQEDEPTDEKGSRRVSDSALRNSLPLLFLGAVSLGVGLLLESTRAAGPSRIPVWILADAIGIIALAGGFVLLLYGNEERSEPRDSGRRTPDDDEADALPEPTRIPPVVPPVPEPLSMTRAPRVSKASAAEPAHPIAELDEVERALGAPPRPSRAGAAFPAPMTPRKTPATPAATKSNRSAEIDAQLAEIYERASRRVSPDRAEGPPTRIGTTTCVGCDSPLSASQMRRACERCHSPMCLSCSDRAIQEGHPGVCPVCVVLDEADSGRSSLSSPRTSSAALGRP